MWFVLATTPNDTAHEETVIILQRQIYYDESAVYFHVRSYLLFTASERFHERRQDRRGQEITGVHSHRTEAVRFPR